MFACLKDGKMNYDDRILQFDVVKTTMDGVEFDFVEDLGTTENRGGYGSTGTK
ncbi:MAG: hypothetical protein ACRCWG_15950 [Sarcina sp.]